MQTVKFHIPDFNMNIKWEKDDQLLEANIVYISQLKHIRLDNLVLNSSEKYFFRENNL